MDHEVACVDITPLGEGREKADLCAVGLWTEISVRMLQLPSLEAMYTQLLGGGEGEHVHCIQYSNCHQAFVCNGASLEPLRFLPSDLIFEGCHGNPSPP